MTSPAGRAERIPPARVRPTATSHVSTARSRASFGRPTTGGPDPRGPTRSRFIPPPATSTSEPSPFRRTCRAPPPGRSRSTGAAGSTPTSRDSTRRSPIRSIPRRTSEARRTTTSSPLRFHPTSGEVYVSGSTFSADCPGRRGAPRRSRAKPGRLPARLTPNLSRGSGARGPRRGPGPDGVLERQRGLRAGRDGRGRTGVVQRRCPSPAPLTGAASAFAGPAGASYALLDAAAAYGSIPASGTRSCSSTPNCLRMSVTAPANRPAPHWDTTFLETPSTTDPAKTLEAPHRRQLHRRPRSASYYRFVEAIFHHGVTAGCGTATLLPEQHGHARTDGRLPAAEQARRRRSPAHRRRALSSATFPTGDPFARWIEQLTRRGSRPAAAAATTVPTTR